MAGVVLVFFGARRIPELMRGMGRGVRELKDELSDTVKSDGDSERKDN